MSILSSDSNAEKLPENERPALIEQNKTGGRKKLLFLLVGVGISVALILYLFRDVDIAKLKNEFSRFNPWYLFPLTALIIPKWTMPFRVFESK